MSDQLIADNEFVEDGDATYDVLVGLSETDDNPRSSRTKETPGRVQGVS